MTDRVRPDRGVPVVLRVVLTVLLGRPVIRNGILAMRSLEVDPKAIHRWQWGPRGCGEHLVATRPTYP